MDENAPDGPGRLRSNQRTCAVQSGAKGETSACCASGASCPTKHKYLGDTLIEWGGMGTFFSRLYTAAAAS